MCQEQLTMMASTAGEEQQQNADTSTNTMLHRRNSVSEMEDGEFMKEEDAAILERGIRDSCSSGETPILAHHVSNKDVPVMVLDNLLEDSPSSLTARGDGRGEKSLSGDVIDSLDDSNALGREGEISHSSSRNELSKPRGYRRCLSGDIRRNSRHEDVEEGTDASPESVIDELHHHGLPSEFKPSASSFEEEEAAQIVRSSRTMDRLMNEVTQYAEAVGELPPSDESQLREIIEDEESDSDDSSEGIEIEEFKDDRCIENELSSHALNDTKRSDSFERKLKEAAQYAEAVGEAPPSNEAEVRELIYDDVSGSDDEDSADEVRVDIPAPPTPTTPQEKQGYFVDEPDQGTLGDETPIKPDFRKKSRPPWPFKQYENSSTFLHKLPDGVNAQDFEYKGICSNPPEVTKRGIQRGNYAQLHRKAWLEVSDKYHRYGKNLRLYYRYWERLGFPHNSFFDWLDSKGEAAGNPLPNLEECPRSQLDSDTVLYITNPDVTERYALKIIPDETTGKGRVVDVDNDPVKTGSDGWIFVLRDNVLYGAQKITSVTGHSKQRFHHSSFFGGKAVAAAGILITDNDGYLTRLFPHSGHYRPGEAHMQRMLFYLHHNGISLRTFDLDTQQIFHVNRETTVADGEEKKKKKVDSLHPMPALYVASYLAHKAKFIDAGIFAQIHKIRKADVTSVREALEEVDDGGAWCGGRNRKKEDTVDEASQAKSDYETHNN